MKVVAFRSRTGNRNEVANKHNKDGYKTLKPPSVPSMNFTKAHLHELLTGIILETSLSEQNEEDITKDEPDSESTLIVNYTSNNAINPGDMRKLMHAPGKSKAVSNNKKTALINEITKMVRHVVNEVSIQHVA